MRKILSWFSKYKQKNRRTTFDIPIPIKSEFESFIRVPLGITPKEAELVKAAVETIIKSLAIYNDKQEKLQKQ